MNITKKHRSIDITCLGEILIDFTAESKLNNKTLFAQNPGGAPANVAVAAARLGANTAFIGKAGEDMHGHFLRDTLQEAGVNIEGLILDEKFFTTLAFVNIDADGERSFSFARKPGADTQLTSEELPLELIENSKILHVGSLSLTDQPSRDATLAAIRHAKEHGTIISYDPNYRASLWDSEAEAIDQMRSLIPYVDVMKLSDEETALLTGFEEPEQTAAQLLAQGVKAVAVTLGSRGAYIGCKEGGAYVPGYGAEVLDTTGAGDAFWGGWLYQFSQIEKLPELLTLDEITAFTSFANAVASLCIERKGAIPAMPTLEMVERRIHQ